MSEEKKTINVDPNILLDSMDELDILINCNVKILETVKSLIKKYTSTGMDQNTSASVAVTLQKHAAEKAKSMVSYDELSEENGDD